MKYGGIHYDYGRLTITFFSFLVLLQKTVRQDNIFIDDISKGQSLKLIRKYIRNKNNKEALVAYQENGDNRIPNIKTLSGEELENSKLKDKELIVTSKACIKSRSKKLNFGIRFIINQIQLPQKANLSFSFGKYCLQGVQNAKSDSTSECGFYEIDFEYNNKASVLNCKMSEFTYSYYKNYLTKSFSPSRFNISREKLAIRACDLLRFLTISFLTTKSETFNSLTFTICNNCCMAVACNCIVQTQMVSESINLKRERRLKDLF